MKTMLTAIALGGAVVGFASGAQAQGKLFFEGDIVRMNFEATKAIAGLGKANGFNVLFYVLPVSETAKTGLAPRIFKLAETFHAGLADIGVHPINDIWVLPSADFGDPSHVNAKGRAIVTARTPCYRVGGYQSCTRTSTGPPRSASTNAPVGISR